MPLDSITTTTPTLPADRRKANLPSSTMGKDEFLKLLLTQLKNQDPNNTQDPTQMVSQLAQFSSLEQMNNIANGQTQANQSSQLGAASTLLGKTVDVADKAGNTYTGQVTSIRMVQGLPTLMVQTPNMAMPMQFNLSQLQQVR